MPETVKREVEVYDGEVAEQGSCNACAQFTLEHGVPYRKVKVIRLRNTVVRLCHECAKVLKAKL